MSTAMRRRSRTRRVLKWVGTMACLLVLAAWIGSAWWEVAYGTDSNLVDVVDGSVILWIGADPRYLSLVGRVTGWNVAYRGGWYYGFRAPYARRYSDGMVWVCIPFWTVMSAIIVPTAWFWLTENRPRPGHCRKCGYDLTGNVSGICPECGSAITSG